MRNIPEILGRNEDIADVFHPIAMAIGKDEDVMKVILECCVCDSDHARTIEPTLLRALMRVLQEEYSEKHPSVLGLPETKTWDEMVPTLRRIPLQKVYWRYGFIRRERDLWDDSDIDKSKTITSKFKRMGLMYRTGSENKSYFDPDHPLFRKSPSADVANYGEEEVKIFFRDV